MQLTIFDAMLGSPPSGGLSRTSPDCSTTGAMPSAPSWAEWSGAHPPSFQTDGGKVRVWQLDPAEAPHGASWTPSSTAWPSDGSGCSPSLSQTLEASPVPTRYYLSSTACRGILRRAEKRGKDLPPALHRALRSVVETAERRQS